MKEKLNLIGRHKWPFYEKDTLEQARELLNSSYNSSLEPAPEVFEFQDHFREEYGEEYDCILCSSGTAALFVGFKALKLKHGSKVLMPCNVFRADVTACIAAGLQPLFYHVNNYNNEVDFAVLENLVTDDVKVILVAHMNGNMVDMLKVNSFSKQNNLIIMEDGSHAHFNKQDGVLVGSKSNLTAFSLGTTKTISGGQLGCILTKDVDLAEISKEYIYQKSYLKKLGCDYLNGHGFNFRASNVNSLLALSHLKKFDLYKKMRRQKIANLISFIEENGGNLYTNSFRANNILYKAVVKFSNFHSLCKFKEQLERVGLVSSIYTGGFNVSKMLKSSMANKLNSCSCCKNNYCYLVINTDMMVS